MARVELETHGNDRAPAGEIDCDVHPLAGVEERAIDLPRRAEQAAVGAEQAERNQLFALSRCAVSRNPSSRPRALQAFRIWSRAQPGATTRSASSSPLTSARLPNQPIRQSSAVGAYGRIAPRDDAGVRDGEREAVAGR